MTTAELDEVRDQRARAFRQRNQQPVPEPVIDEPPPGVYTIGEQLPLFEI